MPKVVLHSYMGFLSLDVKIASFDFELHALMFCQADHESRRCWWSIANSLFGSQSSPRINLFLANVPFAHASFLRS